MDNTQKAITMKQRIDQIHPDSKFRIKGGLKLMEIVSRSTEGYNVRPVGRKGYEDTMRVLADTIVEVVTTAAIDQNAPQSNNLLNNKTTAIPTWG